MRRAVLIVAVTLSTLVAMVGSSAAQSSKAAPKPSRTDASQRVDFNGDGFNDLAVGAPGEDTGGALDAGAVNVVYGGQGGLVGANQTIVQGNPETGDLFGSALAKGDFNADGFTDLAVGAPFEDLAASTDAGAVVVFYGDQNGLPNSGGQVLSQANPEESDAFGEALDTGFFNADGFADLAVGAPLETLAANSSAGAVTVFAGAGAELAGVGQVLTQANPETGDFFGAALVVGDFVGGGNALAVGAPGEDVGAAGNAGSAHVFYNSTAGLPTTSQLLLQSNPEVGDQFGSALAAGYFNADAFMELAVGAPFEDVGSQSAAGAVNIFPGSTTGLAASGPSFVQGPGTGGMPETADLFGASLATGLFDDINGLWDLAVGAPGEGIGAADDAGVVNVLYGSTTGLVGRNQAVSQDTPGVPGNAEAGDRFGAALARGVLFNNFNGDNDADLAVGAPGEGVAGAEAAGAVNVVYGSASGLTGTGSQLFTQGPGTGGLVEPFDNFGAALD